MISQCSTVRSPVNPGDHCGGTVRLGWVFVRFRTVCAQSWPWWRQAMLKYFQTNPADSSRFQHSSQPPQRQCRSCWLFTVCCQSSSLSPRTHAQEPSPPLGFSDTVRPGILSGSCPSSQRGLGQRGRVTVREACTHSDQSQRGLECILQHTEFCLRSTVLLSVQCDPAAAAQRGLCAIVCAAVKRKPALCGSSQCVVSSLCAALCH